MPAWQLVKSLPMHFSRISLKLRHVVHTATRTATQTTTHTATHTAIQPATHTTTHTATHTATYPAAPLLEDPRHNVGHLARPGLRRRFKSLVPSLLRSAILRPGLTQLRT